MKAIINAHVYNTATADVVCDVSAGWKGADLDWHESTLYRTRKGTFFTAGEGGPKSMWGRREGMMSVPGGGLRLLTLEEARMLMEAASCTEDVYRAVGLPLLEG